MSHTYLSRLERSEVTPPAPGRLVNLAAVLGLPVAELIAQRAMRMRRLDLPDEAVREAARILGWSDS